MYYCNTNGLGQRRTVNHMKLLSAVIIFLISSAFLYTFPQDSHRSSDYSVIEKLFVSDVFHTDGLNIPYRYAYFGKQNSADCFLLVYLHGHDACGTDNKKNLERHTVLNSVNYIKSRNMNACMLVPQCTDERQWNSIVPELKSLITAFMQKNAIPTENVFLCGDSMGGIGIWKFIEENPAFAKKAVIIAGRPDKAKAEKITQTPVFVVAGDKDQRCTLEKVKSFVQKINESGGDARLKILKDSGHLETCRNGMSEDVLEWLLGT